MKTVSPNRIRAARLIAVGADLLQIVLLPFFMEGFLSPAEDALDAAMLAALIWLVGWHPAFLPSFVTKLAPALDLAPTWTLAVFFATRQGKAPSSAVAGTAFDVPGPPPEIKRLSGP